MQESLYHSISLSLSLSLSLSGMSPKSIFMLLHLSFAASLQRFGDLIILLITIFGDLRQFSAKKVALFVKTNFMS
jgi:hypothetical protein